MVIYSYRCDDANCGHDYDGLRPMGQADDAPRCPLCGAPGRRRYTPPTIGVQSFGRNMWIATPGRTVRRPYGYEDEQREKAERRAQARTEE